MILKNIVLQNIRSYRNQTIELPHGKTLFEGDVGSGKSTILMAIEFAFFGLGSEKGASLLRSGEHKGKVDLTFELDGKEYTITRGLERKKRAIKQIGGKLKTSKGIQHFSPTELKEKILDILNFNEPPDPKAQSVIYRYAIFTPQEEMKTILFLQPDLRLQTLRKAFSLEDYKIANENTKGIIKKIKEKTMEFEISARDIQEVKNNIKDLTKQIANKRTELHKANDTEKTKENILEKYYRDKRELHSDELKLSGAEKEIIHLTESLLDKKANLIIIENENENYNKKLIQLEPLINELLKIEKLSEKSQEDLIQEISELEDKEKGLLRIETKIEAKIVDFKSIQENENCPTCDRPIKPKEFTNKIKKKDLEKEDVSGKLKNCTEAIKTTKQLLENKRKYDDAQHDLNQYQKNAKEYKKEVSKRKNRIKTSKSDIKNDQRKLTLANKNQKRLKVISKRLEKLDAEIDNIDQELIEIREIITSAKITIQEKQNELENYEEQIKRKEEQQKRSEKLKEYQIWIEDYFIPTIEGIEKHVMLNINQDFNSYFQKWFSLLVEDPGKEARIDEEFTPIVEQDGYDQNIYYLSGGEKTSVALAYRLALNSIVQKVSTGMKSNLLILDEPTDGFSKHQLGKVRDILDELQSPQIVFVSHDKEVESFADQIFRVTKSQGESKVTLGV